MDAALGSNAGRVVVVTGADRETVAAALAGRSIAFAHNADWATGMASSIGCGLRAAGDCDGLLICLGDQPEVRAALLDRVIAAGRDADAIAACDYGEALGPPALFPARCFGALAALEGDRGARALLDEDPHAVVRVPFPGGLRDIDRPSDLVR